jgi:hypothetical protein
MFVKAMDSATAHIFSSMPFGAQQGMFKAVEKLVENGVIAARKASK